LRWKRCRKNFGEPRVLSHSSRLADALRLSGDGEKARKLLAEHLEKSEDPDVSTALASVLRHLARKLIDQSVSHRDRSCGLVIESINRDPKSDEAVDLLLRLRRVGAYIKPDFLRTAVEYWRKRQIAEVGEWLPRVRLAQLYLICGNCA
jgi:hypothetical protein